MNAMPEESFLTTHLHELFAYLNQKGITTIMVVAQHGLVIGTGSPGATFHFRVLDRNTLMLSPVLTKAMVRQAVAHPRKFSAASWAVSVAYAGHTWKRVACDRCG